MTEGPTTRAEALALIATIVVRVERRIAAVAAERDRQTKANADRSVATTRSKGTRGFGS
jgi:hypothetical protein